MKRISKEKILELHIKYAFGNTLGNMFQELIWTHSLIVFDIAEQIGRDLNKKYNIKIDLDLLYIGALVHDIGAYNCFDKSLQPIRNYIEHGFIGYHILKKENYNEKYCRFALCHTGVGLTKDNIIKNKLLLPHRDLVPITLEEEIICYSDNFHTKVPKFKEYDEVKKDLESDFEGNVFRFEYMTNKFGNPDLSQIKKKYIKWHRKVDSIKSKYTKD
jgi:uncharacterized protein